MASLAASLTEGQSAAWWPAAALLAAAVPFAAFATLVLYHFYIKGSFVWDAGLLAYLISSPDPRLATPALAGGGSFFAVHFTPIFVPIALLRRLLPISDAQFFAGFVGLCHALPGLAVFWLLYSGFGLRTAFGVATAALVSIAFGFNGLVLAVARYPHFEMLIVGTALLFFVALMQRRTLLAGLFFALCLLTREDAGFHLFALLFLLAALNQFRGIAWRDQRREIVFAALALGYSLAVLLLQHTVFGGQSSFARIYLGEPVFANLSFALIGQRLLGYLQYRAYLVLPALVALIWAVRVRNPYIVLGYAAFLPWGLLHLFADSALAGTLSGYYAYPFLIAACWPLLGVLLAQGIAVKTGPALPILAFGAMIAVSFTALGCQHNPGRIPLPEALFSPPSLARQAATENAVAALARGKAELGAVLVDGSVLALAPAPYRPDETVQDAGRRTPDTVIYFVEGYEADNARALAETTHLDRHYQIAGTSIRLATQRSIDPGSPLAALLAPAASPQ
ncbi:MAG TPA: hypothetical protein VF007_12080 [Stellaceae bacterium]